MQQLASSGGLDGVIPLNHPYHPYPRGIEIERGEREERGRERDKVISIYISNIYMYFIGFSSISFQNLFGIFSPLLP